MASGSIIDVIHEKASNIEQATNYNNIKARLNESIRALGKNEKQLRLSTITIRLNNELDLEKISCLIEKEWTEEMRQISPTYWQDKEHIYVQFNSQQDKDTYLRVIDEDHTIKSLLLAPNTRGCHFQRAMVKIELPNVSLSIHLDKIKSMINNTARPECKFTELKEGKQIAQTRKRAITLKSNGEGLRHLLLTLNGAVPYVNTANKLRTKIQIRINCRPWLCKDCFVINRHQCQGRLCGNCGSKDHQTSQCQTKTKYCSNCKKRGHRAKDPHCQMYLNEVIKQVRKMDIPIDFFENKELRNILINTIKIK